MLADELRKELALLGSLADDIGLAFARMHIDVVAGDVDVAANDDFTALVVPLLRPQSELAQESELRRKVFAAVRHVHGREYHIAPLRLHDTALHVEGRVA